MNRIILRQKVGNVDYLQNLYYVKIIQILRILRLVGKASLFLA